jgi:tetratricopeptide (TPR) repeat protein
MRLVRPGPAFVAAGVVAFAVAARPPIAAADTSSPDFAHAADLYNSAEQAMKAGNYGDATRDYLAAFDLTADPVLYFKIASANEKAGKCEAAVRYFRLYLANAHPNDNYVRLTQERIAACGGSPHEPAAGSPTTPPTTTSKPTTSASPTTANPDAGSVAVVHSPVATGHAGTDHDAAWITVAGAVALATTGVVLAFAASSSENDVKDLYIGNDGQAPPAYNASTAQHYQDDIDEGHRYRDLAWTSFGLAAVGGAAAAYLFVHPPGKHAEHQTRIVPVVVPGTTGIAAMLAF